MMLARLFIKLGRTQQIQRQHINNQWVQEEAVHGNWLAVAQGLQQRHRMLTAPLL